MQALGQRVDTGHIGNFIDRVHAAGAGDRRQVGAVGSGAELLAGFACVWRVVIFGEKRVETLLRELRPDVHCKGTDYTAETVPEAAIAAELGIRIAIVGDPKDHASTEIIEKMKGG